MLGFIYGRIIMFFGRVLSIRGVIYLSGVMRVAVDSDGLVATGVFSATTAVGVLASGGGTAWTAGEQMVNK